MDECKGRIREDFIEWFDAAVERAVPVNPNDYTRKQLVDRIQTILWDLMEEHGGLIPPDDSLDRKEIYHEISTAEQ